MEKIRRLICLLFLLVSCAASPTSSSSSNSATVSFFSENVITSSIISSIYSSSSLNRPEGQNPDGGGLRMPLPENKNNKIVLGKDNSSMSSFPFENYTLPDYFRPIYGNNFYGGDFYADGTLKISSSGNAKKGFQTAMFEGDLKLEIRLHIGQMNNASGGDKIDKDSPVLSIYGFSEEGDFIRAVYVDEFTKSYENNTITKYMDGANISYLEVRAMQSPYKNSQAYNFAFKDISLIAWPYSL